jgi:hypothetical protein
MAHTMMKSDTQIQKEVLRGGDSGAPPPQLGRGF